MKDSSQKRTDLSSLKSKWGSSIVARRRVGDFSGGLLSEKYLANLDSAGKGPARIRIGRQVAYPVDSLISWMESRSSNCQPKGGDEKANP